MGEVTNMLQRMKELSVQSANGTLSDGDKDNLQAEFAELIAQIDDIANRTTFNGVALADGTNATVSIQTGTSAGETVDVRSEEHTSELQSLMRISYAVFCLQKKK